MQICERHKSAIKEALSLVGFNPRIHQEAIWQAESLILMNALQNYPQLADSPPGICPLCGLSPLQANKWLAQTSASIKKERQP
jgi:hypothetical protein